jgi:putative endonuclease
LTNNLERRFNEHNNGKNKSTKAYVPWQLIYVEGFETRIEARKREKYLKSGIGREFIKEIVKKAPWRN